MSDKTTAYLLLNGCDDSTYLQIDLSQDEIATLKRVFGELNKASKHGCQPTARLDLEKPIYWKPDDEALWLEGEQK